MKLLLVTLEMGMAGKFFNKDEGSEVTPTEINDRTVLS